jgi:hypothetical protein
MNVGWGCAENGCKIIVFNVVALESSIVCTQ